MSERKRGRNRRDPEATRERILRAAVAEFAAKGLGGARVDAIAARARANKRMLYHYFGNKEALYLAALESVYAKIRAEERTLRLEGAPPLEAIRRLVIFTWDHFIENPQFLSMLATENLHRARYLKTSPRIQAMHSPLVALLARILERGAAEGTIRRGIDPTQLYISIAALGYFYLSNIHTLSTVFSRDFALPEARARRREHIVEVILGYLNPASAAAVRGRVPAGEKRRIEA